MDLSQSKLTFSKHQLQLIVSQTVILRKTVTMYHSNRFNLLIINDI